MKNYVIINGVNSNTIAGLMINELPPITKPQMRAIQEEIDGRDGDITTNLGYSAYDKTITIGLFGTGYDIDDIVAFFNGEGTIVFSNEDDKYYNFKILNQIDYVSLQKFKSASITFHCQPFKYPLTETPLEIEYSYVSDEGETISLNTASGEMKVNLLGNTSQTGTPTPSSPIDVNVVSGDNEVVVCGKNLVSSYSRVGNQMYLNGTTSTTDYIFKAGTYTISYVNNSNSTAYVFMRKPSSSSNENVGSGTSVTFTSNEEFNVWVYISDMQDNDVSDIQLELGTATSYEPYQSSTYPIHLGTYELCKIGTYQDRFIRNSGKNLFDGEIELGNISADDGTLSSNNSRTRSKNFIKVQPNTTYYYKHTKGSIRWIIGYKSDKTGITDGNWGNHPSSLKSSDNTALNFSFTTSPTTEYIKWYDTNCTDLSESVMTSLQDIPYEPYGNGDLYLEKHIGKVVLDGSETWADFFSAQGFYRYTPTIPSLNTTDTINCICNYYKGTTRNEIRGLSSSANNKCSIYSSELVLVNTSITSVNDFKTWLGTHNTTIYYVQKTPTYTKIEGTLKDELEAVWRAYSFEGTTNISQVNNDKAFILNVVAMKEGSNEVQVNNIGNTYSKPLIALEGTGNINIYLDNTQILQANVEDKMNIDIAKLEAYNPDTSVLLNRQVIGNYNSMTIPSGTSIVRMDGELTKATITNYTRWL